MPFQILLNLLIAFVWMFLNNSWAANTFIAGYLIGLGLIFLLRRFIPTPFYLKKLWAILALILLFLKELILSNFAVMKLILQPKLKMKPGIIALPTELTRDWEISTLACLITLTPGTVTVDLSLEGDILYIHAMDIQDAEEVIAQIKNTFEKAILEVSR